MDTTRLTMGQALIRFLDNQYLEFDGEESKFVKGIFTIFGHGNVLGFGEGLEAYQGDIRTYQGKNEQGMALAAVGFAKQANRRAIIACSSSIGPGALNFTTAAGTATANRIPLLLLVGDTYACRQPDPVLQQLEQPWEYGITANDALRPLCRYWDRITRPEQLMSALINAFRVLVDPADTGAVTLALPQDVQGEAYDYPDSFFEKRIWHMERRPPAPDAVERAAALFQDKKRPLLVCGGGVLYSEAAKDLREFAEHHNIPIAETQAGKSALPWSHPLNLCGVGVSGSSAANLYAAKADLIIAVGTRLGDFNTSSRRAFLNPDAELISINVSTFDACKMNACQLVADAKLALKALDNAIGSYRAAHDEEIACLKKDWNHEVDRVLELEDERGLTQPNVLKELRAMLGGEDIIVSAAGSLPDDVRKYWRTESYKSYHCEYGFSCMGYEVNAALGAKLAQPERDVWALIGDGGWQMLHSEILTALQENVKIHIVVFDNQGFGCIEGLQNSIGIPTFCTKTNHRSEEAGRLTGAPLQVDYAKLAEGYGAVGLRASTREELQDALAKAREAKGTVLIDVKILPQSMGPRYHSWWRVGAPEVSECHPEAVKAYETIQYGLEAAWEY